MAAESLNAEGVPSVPQVAVVFLCSFALIFHVSSVFMFLNLIEADTLQMAPSNVP